MSEPNITLYHAPMSRSVRVRWCLEEMGLPHTLENLGPITANQRGNMGGEAFKAINPMQKIPAMTDGDRVMLESVAMVEYLVTRYGPTELAVTPDEPDYDRYLEWMHFSEGTMSMAVNLTLAHTTLLPEEQRMAQRVLRNANVPPAEVSALSALGALREQLRETTDPVERERLMREFSRQDALVRMKLERSRSR